MRLVTADESCSYNNSNFTGAIYTHARFSCMGMEVYYSELMVPPSCTSSCSVFTVVLKDDQSIIEHEGDALHSTA